MHSNGVTLAALGRALAGAEVTDAADVDSLIDAAVRHRVGPLLAHTPFARALRPAADARLAEELRLAAVHSAVLDDELSRVLKALNDAGAASVVIKGAHLNRRVYPNPGLRSRSDTDLLIHAHARADISGVLRQCGYRPVVHVSGHVILGQFHFERRDRAGIAHNLDVHWRIAAPLVLDRALPARAIFDASEPFPVAGPGARAPSLPHALAIACLHLAAHHRCAPDLLWLYDVQLLSGALKTDEREAFCSVAAEGRFCAIAAHVLRLAEAAVPLEYAGRLAAQTASWRNGPEPSAALLRDGRKPLDDLLLDLKVAGLKDGIRLLREHLLPAPSYMQAAFGDRPLALAYARRALRGARRWI